MKSLLLLLFILCSVPVWAQHTYSWEDFVQEMLEQREEEGDDTPDDTWDAWMSELHLIHEHPINLTTATRQQLEALPFLSETQAEAIMEYAYMHNPIHSLEELKQLPSLDFATLQMLRLFVCVTALEPRSNGDSWKGMGQRLKGQFDTRIDIPLYYREGYSQDDGYIGDPLYHRMRYTLDDQRHLGFGLRMEKDPGERWCDAWGGYAEVKDAGVLQHAIVGDYRVGWGEGLIMGGGGWGGKSMVRTNTQRGIRHQTGMDETRYMRGAAATLRLKGGMSLSAFASHQQLDATLNKDGTVKTILSQGLHRTEAERDKKHNLGGTSVGGHLAWQHGLTTIGLTGLYQHFYHALLPISPSSTNYESSYRRYYPQGRDFGNIGLHYSHTIYRWQMGGETAMSLGRKGVATTNRVDWTVNESWRIGLTQRYYSRGYYSRYATATSESGGVRNENAVTLRVHGQGLWGWTMMAYVDLFYHAWPRYQMTHSSAGQDAALQLTRPITRRHTLLLRYQMKRKEASDLMQVHHRLKAQLTSTLHTTYRLQSTATLHAVKGSLGVGVSEGVRGSWLKDMLRSALTLSYFYTPDYLSRIYLYEPQLYASVSSTSLFGHGLRAAATLRFTSRTKRYMLEAKIASLRYLDRDTQGTGLQLIHSPWKSDISIQCRIRLPEGKWKSTTKAEQAE